MQFQPPCLRHRPPVRVVSILAAVLLSACGGGNSSSLPTSSGESATTPTPIPPTTPTPTNPPGGSVSGTTAPTFAGCAMFPSEAIFNTRIDALPKHASSDNWISRIDASAKFHADWGQNEDPAQPATYWGIPTNAVDGTATTTQWPRVSFDAVDSRDGWTGSADESDCAVAQGGGHVIARGCNAVPTADRRFPFPLDGAWRVEGGTGGGDHHLLVVESGACRLWEAYYAYPNNGVWSVLSTSAWDLNRFDQRPVTWTSGDAAGLPILPLLVRADEANSGEIRHALRVTFRNAHMRNQFVWPARHQAGISSGFIPFGALLRLKSDVVIPDTWTTQAKAVARAMQRYGLYVADNGSNLYVQGEPSATWQDATVEQLQTLGKASFEFVDLSAVTSHPSFSADSLRARW